MSEQFDSPMYLYIGLSRMCRLERIRNSDGPVKYKLHGKIEDRCTDFKHKCRTVHEYHSPLFSMQASGSPPHTIIVARNKADRVEWLGKLLDIEIRGSKISYTITSHPDMTPPTVVSNLGTSSYMNLQDATLFIDTTRNLAKVSSFLKTTPTILTAKS